MSTPEYIAPFTCTSFLVFINIVSIFRPYVYMFVFASS